MGRPTKPSDPSKSGWWLVPIGIAAIAGLIAKFELGLSGWWAIAAPTVVALLIFIAGPTKTWLSDRAGDKRTAELAGAEGTIQGMDLVSLRVHRSDLDVSEFAARDLFTEVQALLADGKPVLIEGASMAGKTRLVVEVLKKGWPSSSLWFPKDDGDIGHLISAGQDPTHGAVVFFDDVDRFLANGTLTLTLVDRWVSGGCVVVATITSSKFSQWRDNAEAKILGWDVLNRFEHRHLKNKPSAQELEAIEASGYRELADNARQYGLPAWLGGAPLALKKFDQGAEERSWGWALVRAAANWRRVGLGPASTDQLQAVAQAVEGRPLSAPDWDEAWRWAKANFNHSVALLNPSVGGKWEVLDVVADRADWEIGVPTLAAMVDAELNHWQRFILALFLDIRLDDREDDAGALLVLRRLMQDVDPDSVSLPAILLATYAQIAAGERLGDRDRAEGFYERAVAADPLDANILGNYALFLRRVRGDHDRAEELFERAVAADLQRANNLGNYAIFLRRVRGDHDRAEELFERAVAADPQHANILGNYALFLTDVRGDHDRAEGFYERAVAADPLDANILGNYAQLLFARGQDLRGVSVAQRALALSIDRHFRPLRAECNFYLFAHSADHRQASGEELKELLDDGVSTGDWSFGLNLARLDVEGDERLSLCTAVAEALAIGDPRGLDEFDEWRAIKVLAGN